MEDGFDDGASEGWNNCPRTRNTQSELTRLILRDYVIYYWCFQVPYELLNKKFRGIQKIYDREITSASNTSGELASCALKSSGATVQEICGFLDGVVQRVSSLKRKAEESTEEELDCTRLCKARLDHLKSYASGMWVTVGNVEWGLNGEGYGSTIKPNFYFLILLACHSQCSGWLLNFAYLLWNMPRI